MGFMSPKISAPPPPIPPVVEDTEGAKQDYQDRMRARRGRAASILTKAVQPAPQTAAKALLGG